MIACFIYTAFSLRKSILLPLGPIHATRTHAILYMRLQKPNPENQPVREVWFLGHLLRKWIILLTSLTLLLIGLFNLLRNGLNI